jgi:magnesium and cobalt transporter
MRPVPIRADAKRPKLIAMSADSESKPGSAASGPNSILIDATGRRPAVSVSRPLFSEIAARLGQAVRGLRKDSTIRQSLEKVIEESERETQALSVQERLMLANLLTFGELAVSDVMVPRADIVAVEEQTSFPELIALFREAQHSRLPLYRESLDDPLGMLHIKDVFATLETGPDGHLRWPPVPIAKLKRDVLFVPPAMPARDLLLKMQATQIHLALVVDEYGGTDGLVSIEDLVEEIVGDIADEHDVEDEPEIILRPDGKYDADARASIADFKERTGIDLTLMETEEEVDTLGGVVAAALGRVPVRGEMVSHAGVEFEVLEADARRAMRLRIRTLPHANSAQVP